MVCSLMPGFIVTAAWYVMEESSMFANTCQ